MESSCDNNNSNSSNLKKKDNRVTLYPVILPASEATLETESVNSECEQWPGDVFTNNSIVPQTSTINVEKSSDVVIGPLTQFHGPVTIYQNISSDNQPSQESLSVECKGAVVLNGSAKPTPDSSSSEKLHPSQGRLVTSYIRLAIYLFIGLVMLVTIVVSIAVSLNVSSKEGSEDDKNGIVPNVPVTENSNGALGEHIMFTRNQWGGRPPLNFTKPLKHPTEYVLISHTAGKFCKDFEECAPMVQNIQSGHVANLKTPDIGYNFLIGGDGNIYIGRGWDIRNFHRDNNIGISFMGNFVFDSLTTRMVSALKELLELGVKLNKLPPDYKLVCHNQTYATLSPGENVFKEMIKLANYYPGRVQIP